MQIRSPWKRTQANKERKKPKPTILGRPVIPCVVPRKSETWMIDDCVSKCSCFLDELTVDRTSSRITISVPFPQSEWCYEYFILTDPWTRRNLLHRQGTSSSNKSLEAKLFEESATDFLASKLPGDGFNNFFKSKKTQKTKWANVKNWKLKLYLRKKKSFIQNDWNNSENERTFDYHLYSEKNIWSSLKWKPSFQESPGAPWDLWSGKLGRRPRIPLAKYRLPAKISWHQNSVVFVCNWFLKMVEQRNLIRHLTNSSVAKEKTVCQADLQQLFWNKQFCCIRSAV